MAIVLGGLTASLVMGMWEMVVEALIGQGFFAPVVFIAATVLRDLQTVQGGPGLGPTPALGIVLGLMGHMMNSVVLGIVFALVVRRYLQGRLGLAVAGMVYGAAIFVVMWLAVLPLIDPVMLQLNAVSFFLAHLMWGAVLGLATGWRHARVAQPRRAHSHALA